MQEFRKRRIGVYFDEDIVRLCDAGMQIIGAKNRSDYLTQAVKFYTAVLMKEQTADVLTPALESVIHASIKDTENHLAKVIYKEAIANAMMMHVMAEVYDIDPRRLDEIRGVCVQEIKRLNGRFKFEDAVDYEG